MSGSKFGQYAPQTGEYAVKVKNGSTWRSYKTCRLQISVGQAYHEGAKFEATINWVKERFEKVIICVNDTLQRYNSLYLSDTPADISEERWNTLGNEWIGRYNHLFSSIPDCRIYKWNDWRLQSGYDTIRQQVDMFYKTNNTFRDAITGNIREFWERNSAGSCGKESANFDSFSYYSKLYLLEETAVFSMMFKTEDAVDIYPGSVLVPAILFRGNPAPGMPEGLDKGAFTRIDFKRNIHRNGLELWENSRQKAA